MLYKKILMTKKIIKTDKILDVTFELLKNEGDFGVTMRKVATLADMSLSNVQYYFKNKDILLKAVADRYFHQCLQEMERMPALASKTEIKAMVQKFLSHGYETTDMCRIFREYWAISTRNEVIETYLQAYYEKLSVILSDKLQPIACSEQALSKAISLLIAYSEGYSITASALPGAPEVIGEFLSNVVCKCLEGNI